MNSLMASTDLYNSTSWSDPFQPFKKTSDLIWAVGGPSVCAFGIFGNFMIILIMLRLPASTSSVFFHALAWSDQVLLFIGPLADFISRQFSLPYFRNLGTWQCKVYKMALYVTTVLSPWMLVALCVLRASSVLWPLRVNAVWTKGKSRVTAGILTTVVILIQCHLLYGFDIACGSACCYRNASESYRWFFDMIWGWIDMMESCFLPFVFLGVSNSVLLWKVFQSVKTSKRVSVQQTTTQDARQGKVSSLAVTLIAASISFFLLTSPITVYLVIYPYIDFNDPFQNGQYQVLKAASYILWNANSAVNFYLYCLTGAKFRAEFLNMISEFFSIFHKTKKGPSQHRSTTSSKLRRKCKGPHQSR